MLKILEIGPERRPQAHLIPGWEEAEIMSLDIDPEFDPDILADAANVPKKWFGKFDGVFASHILEHFGFWEAEKVLAHWKQLLKPGGELHVVVPSAEWAGKQLLSENPSWAIMPHLYGSHINQWQGHKSCFTMLLLRKYFDSVGLGVVRARTGPYHLQVEGQIMIAEQHYCMGVKKGE